MLPNMRKRLIAVAAVVFALTGCAAQTAEKPAVTDKPSNAQPCAAFEMTTTDLANRMVEGSNDSNAAEYMQTMQSMRGRFDTASLNAHGDVKERISTLVDNLPDKVHMLYLKHDQYFEDIRSVDRACAADGHPINPTIWN